MFFFTASASSPLRHLTSGKLISQQPFLHRARNLDTFVLLLGCQGTLYLEQENRPLQIGPGQFALLFPGVPHRGVKPSAPGLSYYWCHFQPPDTGNPVSSLPEGFHPDPALLRGHYVLPEAGQLESGDRAALLFRQLLDTARRGGGSATADYALSLLMLELSQELYAAPVGDSAPKHPRLAEIMEWVRANCDAPLTVQQVAETFSYHPDYLSALFKAHTGQSLLQYLFQIRLSNAKQLLLNSTLTVREIAGACGYLDDKRFMKRFKESTDMTPTQYRNAFQAKHINSK